MLSVSALCSYTYCKRKFYLQYALKLRVPMKKDAALKGTIRHEAEDKVIKGMKELVCSTSVDALLPQAQELCQNSLKLTMQAHEKEMQEYGIDAQELHQWILPKMHNHVAHRVEQIVAFAKKTGLSGEQLWDQLIPKVSSEVWVTGEKLGVRGIIDQLEDYTTHVLPIELKTGKTPTEGVWPSHKIQAACYMMLLNEQAGEKKVKRSSVLYLDSGESRTVVLNPFLEMEIHNLIRDTSALRDSSTLPDFCANTNKCKSCQYYDKCYDEKFMKDLMAEKKGLVQQPKMEQTAEQSKKSSSPQPQRQGSSNRDLRSFF